MMKSLLGMDKQIPLVMYKDGNRHVVGTLIMGDEIAGDAYFDSRSPLAVSIAKSLDVDLDRPAGIHIPQTMTEVVIRLDQKLPFRASYSRKKCECASQ